MACVAAISVAFGTSACGAKDPESVPETNGQRSDAMSTVDRWEELASSVPSDMTEIDGNTFGLNDWRQPTAAGQAQGFFGLTKLGSRCIAIVGPGILSDPSSLTVMVETRLNDEIIDPQIVYSIEEVQHLIDSHSVACE